MKVNLDLEDPREVAAAWTQLAEPGDEITGALRQHLGSGAALRWLIEGGTAASQISVPAQQALNRVRTRLAARVCSLEVKQHLRQLASHGGGIVVPTDREWPARLNDLGAAAPPGIWFRGNLDLLEREPVALVGARASSSYGTEVAQTWASELAAAGHAIVSGGAFGIDAAAHRGALPQAGSTIAIMAGGIDRPYPAAHTGLLGEIARTGLLLAEPAPGAAPMRQRFLQRNRLIAALAKVTVIVEAAWRSGALNTARRAADLLRPVGVVPGPVTSASSAGCHRLLREGTATLVSDPQEVRELISPLSDDPREALPETLPPTTRQLWEALPTQRAVTVESLCRSAALDEFTVRQHLRLLELDGLAKDEAGKWRRP